jgi:hypothetical protein
MKDAQQKPQSAASNLMIGLALMLGGLLWIALILFVMADVIGDYREAHSPEFGSAPPWTFRDTLPRIGGIGGVLISFAPPSILLGYGSYLLFTTLSRFAHQVTGTPNDIKGA